ncbi:NUDIX hydrolase [Saccharothrix coeruleofusca]|uniref:NUDIX hydrolase n=1 Tax=Saccharothrix coeruleofusca TaxID=33919 RepID=UPI001E4C8C3E|nr:NUDIX domain-containing protein [Saccharothrix coeruleofusca]
MDGRPGQVTGSDDTSDEAWEIPLVALAVDLAVLTVRDGALQVMLVERGIEPYRGMLALPGGFLADTTEDVDRAAARELAEETGLDAAGLHLEQLRTYGEPGRDPRGRVVTVCYVAFVPGLAAPTAGGDARAAAWTPVDAVLRPRAELAFDHKRILADAVERARSKLEYTTLAATFCAPEFTVTELRQVYETVWGQELDARNFHRKVTGVADFLVPTGTRTSGQGGRPAALYRRGPAHLLHPAMLRPPGPKPPAASRTS